MKHHTVGDVRKLARGAVLLPKGRGRQEPSVRYEANCEAATTDRSWPVSDTRHADYLLGNDNNRFGIYGTLVDVVEPCARLAVAFLGRR
jgi:hypothetical protein